MSQFDDLRKMYPQYANVSDEQFASFLAVPAPVSPVEPDSEQAPVGWLRGTANIFGASSKDALANTLEGVSQLVRSESSDWAAQLRDSADSTRSRLPEERLQRMYEAGFRKDSKNTVGGLFDATVGGLGSLSVILPTTAAAALAAPKTGGASLAIPLAATTSVLTPMLAGSAYTTAVEELNQIAPEQLMQSPDFRNYFRAALSDIEDPEAAFQSARKKLTDDLAEEALMAGAAAGAGSSLVVGPLLSRFIGGATAGSIPKSILRGAQIEGIEETFQSGTEAFAREHAKSVATGQPLDVNTALRDTAFGTAIGAAAGGVIGAPAGLRSPVQQANEIVEDARRSVADQGGDALDQELAASEIHSAVMPDAVMGEMEQAGRIDTDLTARIADIDSLTRIATELGAAEEAADLQVARRYFQRAMDAYKTGDTQAAQEFIRSAEGMIQRATLTTERALEGTLVGGEIIPSLSTAQLGDVFDQSPDPAQLNGTRGLLNDAGVIYGQEPSEITTARQQRQADNFSAFYGQEGTAQFRSDVVTGELDRSSELPPAPERSALPPGTGQIDLGRDRSERAFTPISSEYPGVGRNVIERQSQAAPALPQGNTARSITQAQMIDLQDQYRQAIRVPVRDRTPEQKQAVETINAVRSGDIAVVESPPATSSVVDTETTVNALQAPVAETMQTLIDSELLREHRGRWQYRAYPNAPWKFAGSKESAIETASNAYQKARPGEITTRAQRNEQADREEYARMDARYGNKTDAEITQEIGRLDRKASSSRSNQEFTDSGRRTGAAVSNEASRSFAEERDRLARYLESRNEQQTKQSDARRIQLRTIERRKAARRVNPEYDELLTAIAKEGGISRTEAEAQGIDPDLFKTRRGFFLVFNNGKNSKSVDQMAEALSQYGYIDRNYTVTELLDKIDQSLSGNEQYTPEGAVNRAQADYDAVMLEAEADAFETGNYHDATVYTTPDGFTLEELAAAELIETLSNEIGDAEYAILNSDKPIDIAIEALNNGQTESDAAGQNDTRRGSANEVSRGAESQGRATDGQLESQEPGQNNQELLTSYTEAELAQQAEQQRRAQETAAQTRQQAEQRAQADAEVDSFTLTGSDRTADVASAAGQNDMFGASRSDINEPGSFRSESDSYGAVSNQPLYSGYERETGSLQIRQPGHPDFTEQGTLDLFAATEVPAATTAQQSRDNFSIRYKQSATGKVRSALDRVITPSDVAHVLAPFRKHGQETMVALVTDAHGNIVNLIRHTKGGKAASSVYPAELIAAIASTENAANVWFGHNHPSGVLEPSSADFRITDVLLAVLDGTDISFKGHVIVAPGGKKATVFTDESDARQVPVRAGARKRDIEITERVLRKRDMRDQPVISSADSAREIVHKIASENALILLTHRHQLIGAISMSPEEMQAIRANGQVNRIFRALDETNASAVIIKADDKASATNMAHFINNMRDIRVLDWFRPSESGSYISDVSRGGSTNDSRGAFFSRGQFEGSNSALSRDQVEAIATRITADWSNAPEMVTVASDLNLPADLQSAIEAQNARGKIDGVFHKGRFYLVADKIRTEADVERIVLHEALGHYGLRQLYGPALGMHMDRLFNRVGGYKGIQRLGKKYGFDLSSYWENPGDMSIAQRREMMADELVAHIAGTGTVEPDLIQQIAHLIREGLRKMMAGTRFADRLNQMTDVEVLRIVAAARQAVTKGESRITMLTHDPRFVREFEKVVYGEKSLADDARFSRTDKTAIGYEQRIDDLFAGAPSNRKGVKVLDRADVLDLLGHGDKPLHLAESAVRKKENGTVKHKMTAADWKRVPSWIENPVAVFRSQTSPNRLVLFAPDLVGGRPVRVILQPNSTLGQMDVHLTINAYEEGGQHITPVDKWVKNGDLLYLDQEKSPAFSERSGLRLPKDVRQLRGYPRIVVTESELVKYREENPDTRFSRVADDNYDHSIERKTGSNAHLISKKGALEPAETNDTASNLSIASESESSTVAVPLSNEDLRAGIRAILPDFKDGDNRATIVNSFSGLPDVVKQEAKNQGSNGDDVEGVFHNGTIYVVADKITSVGQLETLLFHEGTHGGVNALYADEGVSRAMNRLYAAMGGSTGFNKVVDQLGIRNKIEPYIKGTLQRNTDGRVAMPRELRNTILMQEVLAYTGEKGSKSFQLRLRELVGAVRNWLREHGFLNLAELGVTDIAYTARRARESGLSNLGRDGISYFRFSDKVHKMFKSDQSSFVTDSPAITPRWKEFTKLRAVWDSASDVLRRTDATRPVADAIDRFYDQTREHMGTVNTIIDPIAEKLRKTGKADRNAALKAFEQYMADRENGRKPSMNDLPDLAQEMVNAWAEVADVTGTINQASGVKVFDAKIGKWRDIGKIGEFWPRKLKKEIQNALLFPNKHDATWRQMAQALFNDGRITENSYQAASEYLGNELSKLPTDSQNDYFAGVEKARGLALPEAFYDYSWDAGMQYKDQWAEATSRIQALGQRAVMGTDLIDQVAAKVTDKETLNYLKAVQDRMYNTMPNDSYVRGATIMNTLATGLQLGNPATALLNLIGGTALNFQAYGFNRSIRALGTELTGLSKEIKEARQIGILIDDYLMLQQDSAQAGMGEKLQGFTTGMLKWGGYTPMETFIRTHGYVVAKTMLRDSLSSWKQNIESKKSLKLLAWYQRNGFDTDKLIAENGDGPETRRLYRKQVNLTQGSYRIDQTPVFVDSPIGKFLFKYQKFGTQLSRLFWINHLKPFIDSITKGGETVTYTKNGKRYSARVRNFMPMLNFFGAAVVAGTALAALREAIFGYNDPGPDLDEIEKALADDDTAYAVALGMKRAWASLMAVGALGFFGNYAQMVRDVSDRQRVKSPIDPPALAPIKNTGEMALRFFDQKTLTAKDFDEYLSGMFSLYRTGKRASLNMLAGSVDLDIAQLEAANRDRSYIRKITRRYADDIGLENRRRAPSSIARTEMSPANRALIDAALLGDSERMKVIVRDQLRKANSPQDVDRMMTSMRAALRAAQPARVSISPSERERQDFLEWAKDRLPEASYARIFDLENRYTQAAIAAGLMQPPNRRQVMRDRIRTARNSVEFSTDRARELYIRREVGI